MTKHYIFDFGNVLTRFCPDELTAAVTTDAAVASAVRDIVFDRAYWDPLDAGTMTDDEAKTAICSRLPQELHAVACDIFNRWIVNLPPIDGMVELVHDIKASGGKLYLLSNISARFAATYGENPWIGELFSLFDGLVFSAAVGMTKPHRDIFEHLLTTYGLCAADCVFIDDSAANLAGAESAGIRGILFDGDAAALRKTLELAATDVEQVDRHLAVASTVDTDGTVFYDVKKAPFRVYGVMHENGKYRRIPEAVAKAVSPDVHFLHTNCAGGRVRFRTDSPFVTIRTTMSFIGKMPHFALTGSAGFDLFCDDEFAGTFVPPFTITDGYDSRLALGDKQMRDITIHFPLYSNVDTLEIGLAADATVRSAAPYRFDKPVVYYGSSITQGACASRPSNAYTNRISHQCHVDHVNLGFSGSALAEDAMIDYIASLDMQVFVCDYDHNTTGAEHLAQTHPRLFKAVREKHPTLPIVLVTAPTDERFFEGIAARKAVIRRTYDEAIASGDKHVYFIDGGTFFGDDGTVEGLHPNDSGFAAMARCIGAVVEDILTKGDDAL